MFGSTHTTRSLAGLAVVAGVFVALIPVAQGDSGFQGPPDAVDRAVATRLAGLEASFRGSPDALDRAIATRRSQDAAAFDAREHSQLGIPKPAPDVIERAVIAQQLYSLPDLRGMPDVVERAAAAGELQYSPRVTTSNGFDWNDFGIGAGAGIGLMLLLLGIGAGVWTTRHGERQVSSI
ncbi:MAG: hypothetical protein M3364_06095 [Actinomycetota bacterium]|nr:hypothetical protein [Actinomycetota bacterium]